MSGVLRVPGEVVVPMDGCDHRTICQFSSSSNNCYLALVSHIEDIFQEGCKLALLPCSRFYDHALWPKELRKLTFGSEEAVQCRTAITGYDV